MKRRLLHKISSYTPNTFIGGVGFTTVTSVADLLTKLSGLVSDDINVFEIDANGNVSCYIDKAYTIPGLAFQNGNPITYFIDLGHNCTSIGDRSFGKQANPNYFKLFLGNGVTSSATRNFTLDGGVGPYHIFQICCFNKITQVGSTSGDNTCFLNQAVNVNVYSGPLTQTNNSGSPDGDLQYVTAQGGTVKYASNYNALEKVSNLTIDNSGASFIDFTWDAPTSSNTIDWYLLFSNGNYVGKTTLTSYTLSTSANTQYTFKIIAIDEMGNYSRFKQITYKTPS